MISAKARADATASALLIKFLLHWSFVCGKMKGQAMR
jgi:hypothetical protein